MKIAKRNKATYSKTRRSSEKYHFQDLKIGDSFILAKEDEKSYGSLIHWTSKSLKIKLKTREVPEGRLVWRVA